MSRWTTLSATWTSRPHRPHAGAARRARKRSAAALGGRGGGGAGFAACIALSRAATEPGCTDGEILAPVFAAGRGGDGKAPAGAGAPYGVFAGVAHVDTLKVRYPEEARALFQRLETSLYPERRDMYMAALERMYFEMLPTLPLIWGASNALSKPNFEGWEPDKSLHLFWNAATWRTTAP